MPPGMDGFTNRASNTHPPRVADYSSRYVHFYESDGYIEQSESAGAVAVCPAKPALEVAIATTTN